MDGGDVRACSYWLKMYVTELNKCFKSLLGKDVF